LLVRRWIRTGMGSTCRELCRWEVGVRLGWLSLTHRHLSARVYGFLNHTKTQQIIVRIVIYRSVPNVEGELRVLVFGLSE